MTRIAWGNVIVRIVCALVSPSADAASSWPSSTDAMPPRTISAAYATSLSDSARIAAVMGPTSELVSKLANVTSVNGIPISICW